MKHWIEKYRLLPLPIIILVVSACTESATLGPEPTENGPDLSRADLSALSGETQEAEVGQFLPESLTVQATAEDGSPLANVEIEWIFETGRGAVAGSGSSASATTLRSRTNASGQTAAAWLLGTRAGAQRASAQILIPTPPTGQQSSGSNDPPGQRKGKKVGFEANARPGKPDAVSVSPDQATLQPGEQLNLVAAATDEFGNEIPDPNLNWRSSDPSVATVDDTGHVQAVGTGSVVVSASSGNVEGTASLNSVSSASTTLSRVDGQNLAGTVGEALSAALSVRVLDEQGQPVSDITVSWTPATGSGSVSSTTSVSDADGLASTIWTLGTVAGSQTLTVSAQGTPSVSFSAEALPAPAAVVRISPSAGEIQVGGSLQYSVESRDAYGNLIETPVVEWSTADGTVASVESTGLVSGVAAGTTEVSATTAGVSGSQTVTVIENSPPAAPTAVSDLAANGSTQDGVTVTWTQVDDGAGLPANYAIRYAETSMSWGDAAATEQRIPGSGIGEQTSFTWTGLQAATRYEVQLVPYRQSTDGNLVYGSLSNIASASTQPRSLPAGAYVEASPDSVGFTALGQEATISAQVRASDGTALDGYEFNFQSSNSSIAEVDNMGRIVARAAGSAAILVSTLCCNATDTVAVEIAESPVDEPVATSLEVSPSSVTMQTLGGTRQLTLTVRDQFGNEITSPGVEWFSSNESVATVGSNGVVTAQAIGSALIVVSAACCSADTTEILVEDSSQQAPSDWDVQSNEPAGMTTIADNRHTSVTPAGWSIAPRRGFDPARVVSDPTAPDQLDTQVLEQSYHGVPDGHEPSFPYLAIPAANEVYLSTIFKVDDAWVHPYRETGIKWLILMSNNGAAWMNLSSAYWDPYLSESSRNEVGSVRYADQIGRPSTRLSNTPLEGVPIYRNTWYKVQTHIQVEPTTRIRVWINDILVEDSELQGGWSLPAGTRFSELQLGGTWGGGVGYTAPDQSVFYAHTYLSVR